MLKILIQVFFLQPSMSFVWNLTLKKCTCSLVLSCKDIPVWPTTYEPKFNKNKQFGHLKAEIVETTFSFPKFWTVLGLFCFFYFCFFFSFPNISRNENIRKETTFLKRGYLKKRKRKREQKVVSTISAWKSFPLSLPWRSKTKKFVFKSSFWSVFFEQFFVRTLSTYIRKYVKIMYCHTQIMSHVWFVR